MLLIFPLIGFNSIHELTIINRGKEISLSEWQNAIDILKELFVTQEFFLCRNYEEIPRRSKNSFSVGMTKPECHSEGTFRD
jgi:hypothetical protein